MMVNPRKVLTPRQMGEVDRATIEAGIPGIVLMENAAQRVVEYIASVDSGTVTPAPTGWTVQLLNESGDTLATAVGDFKSRFVVTGTAEAGAA